MWFWRFRVATPAHVGPSSKVSTSARGLVSLDLSRRIEKEIVVAASRDEVWKARTRPSRAA